MLESSWAVCIGTGVASLVTGLVLGERLKPWGRLSAVWQQRKAAQMRRNRGVEIYVGNLAYEITDRDLEEMFRPHGRILSARVIRDRVGGRSKGYGFVRIEDLDEARRAIQALNGSEMKGRRLVVNEARGSSRNR